MKILTLSIIVAMAIVGSLEAIDFHDVKASIVYARAARHQDMERIQTVGTIADVLDYLGKIKMSIDALTQFLVDTGMGWDDQSAALLDSLRIEANTVWNGWAERQVYIPQYGGMQAVQIIRDVNALEDEVKGFYAQDPKDNE